MIWELLVYNTVGLMEQIKDEWPYFMSLYIKNKYFQFLKLNNEKKFHWNTNKAYDCHKLSLLSTL